MNKSASNTLSVAHFKEKKTNTKHPKPNPPTKKPPVLGSCAFREVVSLHIPRNICKPPSSLVRAEWKPDLLFLAMNLEFTLIFSMLQEAAAHPRGAANRIS